MRIKISFRTIFLTIWFFTLFFIYAASLEGKSIFLKNGFPYNERLLPGEEEYLIAIEKMPAPIGGFESIMKKITYPDMAQRMRVEGKVYVLIYVNENGDVDDVKVVKGIGSGCDEEAVKAIKKSKFTPGMDKGAAVKSKFSMAITFKLQ
ncbi:MAG: energy transducer TonB [Bacteroidota bacterium]